MLRDPGIARARLDGFGHHIQRDSCLCAEHQPLANGGRMHEPKQVGDELDGGAIAMDAHVKDLLADDVEDGLATLECGLRTRGEDAQTTLAGAVNGVGDGRFEVIYPELFRLRADAPRQLHGTGGRVDQAGALPHGGQQALTKQQPLHLGGPGQRQKHHLNRLRACQEIVRFHAAKGQQIGEFRFIEIGEGQAITRTQQIGCDGIAHVASAHKQDRRFGHRRYYVLRKARNFPAPPDCGSKENPRSPSIFSVCAQE